MLQVHSLSKTYAGQPALNGVSFHIERPEVVGDCLRRLRIGAWLREVLAGVGCGSRFAAAERLVIDLGDLGDLVYYGSLCCLFLLLAARVVDGKRCGGPASRWVRCAAGVRLAAGRL